VAWQPRVFETTLESRGLEIAAKMGHAVSKLKALRLEPIAFDRAKRYRIDPRSKRLIEIERVPSLLGAGLQATRKPKAGRKKTAAPRSRSRKRTKR
jgi:hypothetical protein